LVSERDYAVAGLIHELAVVLRKALERAEQKEALA
jgi:hypothetical protein